MSHSQNNESDIVLRYFKGKKGTLLDIGAFDGISLSNSYDLIQAGWRGVLIEPEKRSFDALSNLYVDNKDVLIYNFGISKTSGEQKFFIKAMLSTLYEDQKRGEYTEGVALFHTWHDFYKGEKFEFVSIDAEGADLEILEQMNLNEMGVECLCIEHNGIKEVLNKIIAYCSTYGLKEISRNGENLIFVRG